MSENVSAPVSTPSTPSTSQTQPNTASNAPAQAGGSQGEAAPKSFNPDVFDVKVNGRMVKMTRQEVIDHASMSHAAQSKFDEAAKTRKAVDKIMSTAKSNPIEALMDPALGLTKDQIRDAFEKWYTTEYIEPESLTAGERKLKEYENKLKKYEDEESSKKLKEEQEQSEKLTNQQRVVLQQQIVDAMENSGLPKTKFFASRMAFYMRQNLINGWEAPIDMIVKQVKNERKDMMSDMVQNADVKTLIGLLGDDVINKIRKHDLEELRTRRQGHAPAFSGKSGSAPTSPSTKVYSSEVNRRLRDMRTGKL